MAEKLYFQWQNEFLCKTIYPMRETKLKDFLVYYKEVDLWAEYKNRDISTLKADVEAYENGMETARIIEFKKYTSLRGYFLSANVRGNYVKYKPIEETSFYYIEPGVEQTISHLALITEPRELIQIFAKFSLEQKRIFPFRAGSLFNFTRTWKNTSP